LLARRMEIAKKTRELKEKGLSLREVQGLLCSESANARFVERAYYEKKGQRIYQKFESFKLVKERKSEELEAHGILFDEIADVKEVPYSGDVYDFCIEETHNFVANGFVVSNCGVRLILTNLKASEVRPKVGDLMNHLFKNVPSGVGSKGKLRLEKTELAKAVEMGAMYVIDKGYGWPEDAKHIEENGRLPGADATKVSDMAMKRGMPQFGTLGAGNHFLEVQDVSKILDENIAKAYGLEQGNAVVMLHCGSRGFGHQICDDYIRVMMDASRKYGIKLPDRELCCAPLDSKEAEAYLGAMACAVNYAFCNRQVMTHWIRETFAAVFGKKPDDLGMKVVYDVCHNIAKWENHEVDGKTKRLCVHRKGATRAMGPGREEVPLDYRTVGQPVLIPGSMGTASYVLAGVEGASECFFSTCHGSGRVMSRGEAIRTYKGENIKNELEGRGIAVRRLIMRQFQKKPRAHTKMLTKW
ncbi:MAG: RtcB family protein, partial [Candidatus Micrarchaeota archaeon]